MTETWADYSRLTVDRGGNKVGIDIQQGADDSWAAARQIVIGHRYVDRDVTAADEDVFRKDYEQLLSDLEGGMWDGLVFWRIDRLVRLVSEFERVLKICRKRGITMVSVSEGLSSDRPDDVTMMRMKVLLGQAEIDSMKVRIRANRDDRSKAGLYSGGGKRPYGFAGPIHDDFDRVVNTGKVGVEHVPHEVALLREAARRIAEEGEDFIDIIKDWHARTPPVYGATGAPWNTKTLQHILTQPRIVGKQLYKPTGELVKAVWDAVIPESHWNAIKARVKVGPTKNKKSIYELSGRITCSCGHKLTGATRKYPIRGVMTSNRTYRCPHSPAAKARGACGRTYVLADPVEKIVAARIMARLIGTRRFLAGATNDVAEIQRQLEQAAADLQECDEELEALAELKGQMGKSLSLKEWMNARLPVVERREAAEQHIVSLSNKLSVPTPKGVEWRNLAKWWEGLTISQRQKLIDLHVGSLSVKAPTSRGGRTFDKSRLVVSLTDAKKAD